MNVTKLEEFLDIVTKKIFLKKGRKFPPNLIILFRSITPYTARYSYTGLNLR